MEEVTFVYDVAGLKSLKEMEQESEECKRQFLINFSKLYEVFEQYRIDISENIFIKEDPAGETTRFIYDAIGRLTHAEGPKEVR